MHATRLTATAFVPVFRAPPPPFAHNGICPSDDFPRVVTTHPTPRYRKQRMPLLEVAITCVVLVATAFVAKLIMDAPPRTFERNQRQTPQHVPHADRVVVPQGQGASGLSGRRPSGTNLDVMIGAGASHQLAPVEDVHSVIEQAIIACREGRFDDADELGLKAMRAAPADPRGEAVRRLQAYVRQYSDLADQAVDGMNGATEVDLGRPYGVGAFVERAGDEIVFLARGRHERFTVERFNSLDGVRFRVTRQFLENGGKSANDLILGAVHFVQQRDEKGAFQADGSGVHQAAQARWTAASRSTAPLIADHARALLSLLENAGN
jgi:hypothetical protein